MDIVSLGQFQLLRELSPGTERIAAIAEWFQALYKSEGEEPPVLVGGAVVELLSGGAYTTGDLDFVGPSPSPAVEQALQEAGFERRGRHWVQEEAEIFIELPSSTLDEGERVDELQIGSRRLKILAPEAVLVDRLAAWQHWSSSLDGVTAFLLFQVLGDRLDLEEMRSLATRREVVSALDRLEDFGQACGRNQPDPEQLEAWAQEIPG